MALKVGSTSVVDNTRALQNISTVDSTTAASITAAGVGGGGAYSFTASGAITSGDVVVLNNDGTVSSVTVTPPSFGSPVIADSSLGSLSPFYTSVVFDSSTNKIVCSYRDTGNSYYGASVVGTVSGSSITYGTPVIFNSANTNYISSVFDSNSNKIVVSYSNYGVSVRPCVARVGTVSGTSISFGSATTVSLQRGLSVASTFDSVNNKVVIAYDDVYSASRGRVRVGTVSGTSISFGTETVFEVGQVMHTSAAFDSASGNVVIAYYEAETSFEGKCVVGTVSGTSISFGSSVSFDTDPVAYVSATYDSNSSKVVISYRNDVSTLYGYSIVGTVSGTSISFGTPVVFNGNITDRIGSSFDGNTNKIVVSYGDLSDSRYGKIKLGTVSGTSISFESALTFNSNDTYNPASAFDSNANKTVINYVDSLTSSNNRLEGIVLDTTSASNADSWIGISTEAISDTASGSVTLRYGTNDQQTGLTIGSTYYVADDGSLTTTDTGRKIGKALAADTLLITEPNS